MKTKEEIEREILFIEKGNQYPLIDWPEVREPDTGERAYFNGWIDGLRFVLGKSELERYLEHLLWDDCDKPCVICSKTE